MVLSDVPLINWGFNISILIKVLVKTMTSRRNMVTITYLASIIAINYADTIYRRKNIIYGLTHRFTLLGFCCRYLFIP